MFNIGPYRIDNPVVLAPMAGVTDRPFRQLCRQLGAGLVVSEMVTSDVRLWNSNKSKFRLDHDGEAEPIMVQIAGGDPQMMAEAALQNVAQGAQIIDINMGCPAKKVCNKAAGSALLKDEILVRDILQAVVGAVNVPVTLKTRTGWDMDNRNISRVASLAEECGIQALTLHGRTRACGYKAPAEYDTIKRIKQEIGIPLIANGDITSVELAKHVLNYTGADAIMIGRAAQGSPWIFREINHYLTTGQHMVAPDLKEVQTILTGHVNGLHAFYGDYLGVRIARKHVGWYLQAHDHNKEMRSAFNRLESAVEQRELITTFFNNLLGKDQAA